MNRRYRLERAAPYRPAHPRAGPHADLRENQLSLPVLAALCDIFDVTAAQLIATRAENIPARRRAASSGEGQVTDLNALRPPARTCGPSP